MLDRLEGGGPVLTAHYKVETLTYGKACGENQALLRPKEDDDDDDDNDDNDNNASAIARTSCNSSTHPTTTNTTNTDTTAIGSDCDSNCVVSVRVQSATTTRGGQIVSDRHDATGIMVWPATHVLCHYLARHYQGDWRFLQGPPPRPTTTISEPPLLSLNNEEEAFPNMGVAAVLELGCGCGLVGVVAAALASNPQYTDSCHELLWVSTDRDKDALAQCRYNFSLNGIAVQETTGKITTSDDESNTNVVTVLVSELEWGNATQNHALLHYLEQYRSSGCHTSAIPSQRFDAIVAADIVYPTTCRNQILPLLLDTVDTLLWEHGTFWLAFWSRDGPRTPCHLIEAASAAGFVIDAVDVVTDQSKMATTTTLLHGAKLLQLHRSPNAALYNARLGANDCLVFPGLKEAKARLEAAERQAPEEWNAPPYIE
jgi:SAM-dependent methyltransferase